MGQARGRRVRPVLAADGGRVGHLVLSVAPPEADHEGLGLALAVVAQEELGGVAHVDVHAGEGLGPVLVEEEVVDVVEAAGEGGIRVGHGVLVQEHPPPGIDHARGNDAAGEAVRDPVDVVAGEPEAGHLAEVPVPHGGGRHPRLHEAGV